MAWAISPAGSPAGALRISNRKISSRLGWPSAARAESACGLVMPVSRRGGREVTDNGQRGFRHAWLLLLYF